MPTLATILNCRWGMDVAPKAGGRKTPAGLTHLTSAGEAHMVNVGGKPESMRVAVASAEVRMSASTLATVVAAHGPKGDVLAVARVAALAGLKQTSQLIPLCHPVRVVGAEIDLRPDEALPGVRVRVTVTAFDRTGVEMEAMVGASVAALTVYDMVKGQERGVVVQSVQLEEKSGGRRGVWRRVP